MKKKLLLVFLTMLCVHCYGQSVFEKGYYINTTNEKVECFIQKEIWKKNPTQFNYKLFPNSQTKNLTIESVKEFSINDQIKFVKKTVFIDILNNNNTSIFKEKKLFLEVLTEGSANLYLYKDQNFEKYFYTVKGTPLTALNYNVNSDIENGRNFKKLIINKLRCSTIEENTINNLIFEKNDLIDIFKEYNNCIHQEEIEYKKKYKANSFSLSIRPGVNLSNFTTTQKNTYIKNNITEYNSQVTFRIGAEAQMPIYMDKISFLIEPTFQYYKSNNKKSDKKDNINYKSIELNFGLRYHYLINKNYILFGNALYMYDLSINSELKLENKANLAINAKGSFGLGIGYRFKEKYSLELRYFDRNILTDYINWDSNYQTLSVIFGYSIF